MSDAVNCEYCVNYSYDDDYECYTCEVNLDEDEMVTVSYTHLTLPTKA